MCGLLSDQPIRGCVHKESDAIMIEKCNYIMFDFTIGGKRPTSNHLIRTAQAIEEFKADMAARGIVLPTCESAVHDNAEELEPEPAVMS